MGVAERGVFMTGVFVAVGRGRVVCVWGVCVCVCVMCEVSLNMNVDDEVSASGYG